MDNNYSLLPKGVESNETPVNYGTPIKLGDIVDVTKGKHKGAEMIFLFCIPQHRFGFCYKRRYDNMMETNAENGFGFNMFPEEFITMDADLSMYY